MANNSVKHDKLTKLRLNYLPLNNKVMRRIESLHKNVLKFRSKANKT